MSQIGGTGAPTPRRSTRIGSRAGSVASQSVMTTMTSGGTRQRQTGPLTKVKARVSNAYGASGRVGVAEELSVSATGFAQAFQNQRGDAVRRDDDEDEEEEDEEEEEEDDRDELAYEPRFRGTLNGNRAPPSPSPAPSVPLRATPGMSFLESDDAPSSDEDLAPSVGNTSKSFGPNHEAGMLSNITVERQLNSHLTSELRSASWQQSTARRTVTATTTQEQSAIRNTSSRLGPARANPSRITASEREVINKSVDDMLAEERTRAEERGRISNPAPPAHSQLHQRSSRNEQAPREDVQIPQDDIQARRYEWDWSWMSELPWMRWLQRAFWAITGLFFFWLVLSSTISSDHSQSTPEAGMGKAVRGRFSQAWHSITGRSKGDDLLEQFYRLVQSEKRDLREFIHGDGTNDDNLLWSRMRKIYGEFDDRFGTMNDNFDSRVEEMHKTIQDLRDELPPYIIVRRHGDGRREISDEFWNALLSKAQSQGDNPDWIDFVKQNSAKVKDINGVAFDSSDTRTRPEMISRDEFAVAMAQGYKDISARVDTKIANTVQSQVTAMVQSEVKKTKMDSIRLESLALTNIIANYELHLKSPNYFSTGLGAHVEPTSSSATFVDKPSFMSRWTRNLATTPPRNPPKAALMKWEEPGDCWCAAPNPMEKSQAQLTVALGRSMFPKQVTIEHVPMSMVPAWKITNAPRDIELWIQSEQPVRYQYDHRRDTCQNGPPGWTCLGTFKYNIHASNHVQTFDLDAESSVSVTKAMVRVTTNWGADHTCLYRVRLHGDDAVERHAYEVNLND
ncbi:hypothetical protein P153DRAFT_403291 [Dothidotthia symphoricarpi CBS 119687]|uniref:SUN domain-containing protein n=1 Tax=Dothidotthia symphoricarpi CBS 119687 TaxID=1392245 RepID=A0A6A6AGG4_9PLEO|nr:uncharacterized protein P153DRAFT_403291 [Dothidotthia symphoricarpi CBS 119687]KAF2129521.1 hypothetical protein P153DRAFT_403291 [Dothidotthia symphoricarpi CBS 119687]